jgi:dolichol-phosphate mannosyltransferase
MNQRLPDILPSQRDHRVDRGAAVSAAGRLPPVGRGRRDALARISVVFSFWNEEEVLPELIGRLRGVFDILLAQGQIGDYELIFVNDDSTDRSEEILRDESRRRGDIRIVTMSRNFGVSPCVLAGMLHASGDAVIYMDADLQDPPEVIPELIERWKSDPAIDVVHTVRRVRLGESRIKRLLTRIGYATLRAVASIELPNEAGDFKLLSRRAVDQVVRFREKRPFMRGLVCSIGFGQATVYYDRQPRGAGETKFPVLGWKVIRNFLDSAVISFSDLPLKVAGLLGAVFILASCVWIATLLASYSTGSDVAGWSAALAGTLFMGGLQLFSIGILGSYISGIYFETKGRPNFIVKETFGFAATDAPLEEPKRWTISDY